MKKIKLQDRKISIPTGWHEVTLGDYEKWYFNGKQTGLSGQVDYMADICQIEVSELMDAPAKVYKTFSKTVSFLSEMNFAPAQKVSIDGTEYFISLSDEIVLGEWVDIDAVLGSEDSNTKLSDLLAIVCRPVGEEYDHALATKRAELFRQQSCEKMLPLVSFFLRKEIKLNEILHHSSQVVAAASRFLEDTKTFAASGDGIKRLPIWQRIRFSSLTKSLEKQLSKCSDSFSIV